MALDKKITFFSSFAEAEEHGISQMASHTAAERLRNLEILRRRTYSHLLRPDGTFPPMDRKIRVIYANYK